MVETVVRVVREAQDRMPVMVQREVLAKPEVRVRTVPRGARVEQILITFGFPYTAGMEVQMVPWELVVVVVAAVVLHAETAFPHGAEAVAVVAAARVVVLALMGLEVFQVALLLPCF